MNYLDQLNEPQRAAVENIHGPVMIIAGAGSGKTRVLTYRIAHMINSGIDAFNILSLTFTNKAAAEMKERIQHLAGGDARNLWMGTFHSVFARVLRVEAERLGYPANFTIYDTDDAKSVIKNIIKEQNLNDTLYKPNSVYNRISSAKNSLINWQQYQLSAELTSEDRMAHRPALGKIYELYAKRCFQSGAMDFDDLLLKMHELLERFPDALYKYQNKFKYILIDEFQDTNFVQYSIVKKLGAIHENICVVGDDAQSIYAFRGATIANILNFEKDYTDLKIFKLEQNYRSSKNIVNAASAVIAENRNQLKKEIWTQNGDGNKIKIVQTATDNDEGRWVADAIFESKARNHYHNKDFAILYRTNAQSRSFEEALRRHDITYRVYGGISFYQRKEIKDFICYLRITVNFNDEEALRRVINYPTRGIGKQTLEKATVAMNETGKTLWEILENAALYGIKSKPIEDFLWMIKSFNAMQANTNAYDLAMHIAKSSTILKELYDDKTVEGVMRYENLQEILNAIKEFTEEINVNDETGEVIDKSLGSYLQTVSLLTQADEKDANANTVSLMTVHSAKGLEFKNVFVVGLEEELFPSGMNKDSREDLEEERRLFYVAITRAKENLHVTYALNRYRFGKLVYCEPSRFIDELPDALTDFTGIKNKPLGTSNSNYNAFKSLDSAFGNKNNYTNKFTSNKTSAPPVSKQNATKPQFTKPNTTIPVIENFVASDNKLFAVGNKLAHEKFGIGTLVLLEGVGENRFATIEFENLGSKKIMLKYAKLMLMA